MAREAYQLEARKSYKNTFREGITQTEHFGTNPMENTGVPLNGFKGVVKTSGRSAQLGVPIPGAGKVSKAEPQTPHCTAITKKGDPCKAAPIKGTYMCVGHTNASGS